MNIVDYFLIFFFTGSLYKGYHRGVLKELYDLGLLIISALFAFLLRNVMASIIIGNNDFRQLFNLNVPDGIYDLAMTYISPAIGFSVAFTLIWLILKLLLMILIRKEKVPGQINRFEWLGSVISGSKSIFYYTIVAGILSFAFLTPYSHLYEDSFFAKPLLKLNPPLYHYRNEAVKILDDAKTLKALLEDGKAINSPEVIAVFKDLKENEIITDELIVEVSKTVINNEEPVTINPEKLIEMKTNFQADENYQVVKTLYDEEIITADLITKILEANNITGITNADIEYLFN